MQKTMVLFFLLCIFFENSNAQKFSDTNNIIIINNEKVIKNDMIFSTNFVEIKKPLILVNGEQVYSLEYYNRDEFKRITVLQPKEGVIKYHKKGKNGVIVAELKDEVKSPEIEVVTNKVYYKCKIADKLIDTSAEYYNKNNKDCITLDLRDTSNKQTLYTYADSAKYFYNVIRIKNLGVGWDRTSIYVAGGIISGGKTLDLRKIVVKQEGTVRIGINTAGKLKEFNFKVVKLPGYP